MCELFAVSATRKVQLNKLLEEFFSHSNEHPSGWGMVDFDRADRLIEKEAIKASDSEYLKKKLEENMESSSMIAHIRKATIGEINTNNNHPFSKKDQTGREWVMAHNGTIFESEELKGYHLNQKGSTDSERILLYIVDKIDEKISENNGQISDNEIFNILDCIVQNISKGNKLNLIIFDGNYYYIHKNQEETLYVKKENGVAIFSTTPLDSGNWAEVPTNRLQKYKGGEVICQGTEHTNTYIFDESHYTYLYMAYANM